MNGSVVCELLREYVYDPVGAENRAAVCGYGEEIIHVWHLLGCCEGDARKALDVYRNGVVS